MNTVPKKTRQVVVSLAEKRIQNYERQKEKRRRFDFRFLLICTAVAGVFVFWNYLQMSLQVREQEKQIQAIQAKIDVVKKENSQLKKQKKLLSSDEYIEKIAREELGLVKEGEEVYVIVDERKN